MASSLLHPALLGVSRRADGQARSWKQLMGAVGTAGQWGHNKKPCGEIAPRPGSLDQHQHRHTHKHMHTNNAHRQTDTNERTKSSSKLFNHEREVAEGMPWVGVGREGWVASVFI